MVCAVRGFSPFRVEKLREAVMRGCYVRRTIHDDFAVNSCPQDNSCRRNAIREKRPAFLRVHLIRHAFVVTPSPYQGEGFWGAKSLSPLCKGRCRAK